MVGAAVTLLAVALRVAWVLLVPTKPVGDFSMYLESAAHVVAHGALDPEFVYMPGYVLLVALVQAAGGGLLGTKLLGAALGGLCAGAVHGIGARLFGARAGLVAGLLCALWPGGIAVASVTGTDMPSAALVTGAVYLLVRWGAERPRRAAIGFGLAMGLAAWVRAVAVPLSAFSALYFWAAGASLRSAVQRGALSAVIAAAVLAPWAARNNARYGEWFLTDSHGGLTALVGANPNTDGRYSRSLNRVFKEVTGYALLAEPHREADAASYALAKDWTAFEPLYAVGLVAAKLERLLAHERSLLYWPLYRAGVLPAAARAPFDRLRPEIEAVVDGFWILLVFGAAVGVGVAAARRQGAALALLPIQLCLVGIYGLFFAEARYHLPIAALLMPHAGSGIVFMGALARAGVVALARAVRPWGRDRGGASRGARTVPHVGGMAAAPRAPGRALAREAIFGAGAALALAALAYVIAAGGERLRERRRWAAHVCHAPRASSTGASTVKRAPAWAGGARGAGAGGSSAASLGQRDEVSTQPLVCKWRAVAAVEGASGLQGVWDGVGLAAPEAGGVRTARTELTLSAGRYRVRAALDALVASSPPADEGGTVSLLAGGAELGRWPLAQALAAGRAGRPILVEAPLSHGGGALPIALSIETPVRRARAAPPRAWLSRLRLEPLPPTGAS